MERLMNGSGHVQRPRREVVATAAPLARGRAGSRRFFRESADNVRLDPQGKLAYVGYGDGALAVIDPQQMKKIGDVKLDAIPKHSSWNRTARESLSTFRPPTRWRS